MLLVDRLHTIVGKFISCFLIVTTQSLVATWVYAQDEWASTISEANAFSYDLLNNYKRPSYNANGDVLVDGEVLMSSKELTGQKDNDYIPANTDTYGSDTNTIIQGQNAQAAYESKTTPETSGEIAYHTIKKSFATQKPDLSNDPMWANTDKVYDNLEEIAQDFANCTVSTELVSSGDTYHVPKYEFCEKLPAIEESFIIGHEYEVGIIKHASGPVNLLSCGTGCLKIWIGTVGDNYWPGNCTIYEESMAVTVIQPDKIQYAVLSQSVYDDYHQVYLNGVKIFNGPNGNFPPETSGPCELSTSWNQNPNVNVTSNFRNTEPMGTMSLKTRTSVAGNGEGYSALTVHYDINDLIYNDVWTDSERIEKALTVKKQIDDGFCTGSIRCTDMPSLDSSGCTTINGIRVCESNFKSNPLASLGISPFCRKVEVNSNCSFNEGQLCWEDLNGDEVCFENDTSTRNTCGPYEESSQCSFVRTECVEGATGPSGECYVQQDVYDCGFTADSGNYVEEEVLRCDGVLQCVGESCYSPTRDAGNTNFGQVNAYLEALKYASADMTCEGVPTEPYNADSPPDRYYPMESCEDGFTLDSETGLCLKQTGCTFDADNFYNTNTRDGIQVVSNAVVQAENPSLNSCIPVEVNGVVYTCGGTQQSNGLDKFYAVCTNQKGTTISQGCPDPSHELNPNTGYCEVPPVLECPAGYDLVEGSDPFSLDDDICQSQLYEVDKTCPSGYALQNDQCVRNVTTSPSYYCPSGWALSGQTCKKTSNTTQCKYVDGRQPNASLVTQNRGAYAFWWDGVRVYGSEYSLGAIKDSASMFDPYYGPYIIFIHEICKSASGVSTQPASISCPSGTTLSNGQCVSQNTTAYTATCPTGFTLSGDGQSCIMDPQTVSVGMQCPSLYPVWNEEEGRCEAESMLDSITRIEPVKPSQLSLLDSVLAPFSGLLGSVPVAHADETVGSGTGFSDYLTEKMATSAEAVVNPSSTEIQAQSALMSATTTSGSGTQNVDCQLFQGTASECKIAVGGMQNCCESPVPASLGDYITLTTTMLKMDGLTAQLELVDGYNGVWKTASDFVGETANTAWEGVQGVFASSADAGTAAVEGAVKSVAEDSMIGSFQQAVMGYTRDFLVDNFSKETASMFIEEGVVDGVTQYVASPQLAAVGSALMFVYYAYLAYIVFTLIVSIIYECTDEELDLSMKREVLSTHYIGTYCASDVLGVCIEKRQAYCVFDSPFSRIMMEQVYAQPQMGLSWGTPENPNCTGLRMSQMADVDWEAVNLDEWIGILIETDNFTDATTIDIDSLTGAGSYLDTGDRSNVLEVNIERAENFDADELRRDAYEEGWNKLQ